MPIVLSSGGTEDRERPALEAFASHVDRSDSVLALPLARRGRAGYPEQAAEWIARTLGGVGLERIEVWPALEGRNPAQLGRFGGIFIGGGNTFSLLSQLRSNGFLPGLRRYAERGGPVYGVSAGAIVLGRDIESCIHYDENAVGIEDTAGLDLLGGHCVWCHFEPHHEERITQYIARSGHPFLGCPEGSAIRIDGARTIDIGTVPALHWNTRGQCTALGRDDATG